MAQQKSAGEPAKPDQTRLMVPVSTGELVDKITILRIKRRNISDTAKLTHIITELKALEAVCAQHGIRLDTPDVEDLEAVNSRLWQIEDDIRSCERAKEFGSRFIDLARAVYLTNDERFTIKTRINAATGSQLREEKSYEDYR